MVFIERHTAPSEAQLRRWLTIANWSMVLNLCLFGICLFMSYAIADYLSLYLQIAAHLATIIFAGVFKLAYVLRCFALYNLGSTAF